MECFIVCVDTSRDELEQMQIPEAVVGQNFFRWPNTCNRESHTPKLEFDF